MTAQGLTAITIENFKGIGQAVTIPLRPVTLLFGANSAGKSTIIQALQYAWEILENRNADVDRTRLGGEVIDLGGFQNLVHGHDLSRSISITLHYAGQLKDDAYRAPDVYASEIQGEFVDWMLGEHANVTDWLNVEELSVRVISTWEPGVGPYISSYEVGLNGNVFGRIESSHESIPKLWIEGQHPFFSEDAMEQYHEYAQEIMGGFAHIGGRITKSAALESKMERDIIRLNSPEGSEARELDGASNPEELDQSPLIVPSVIPEWGRSLSVMHITRSESDEPSPMSEEMAWVLSQLFMGAGEAVLYELRGLRYLGPLRSVPERGFTSPLRLDPARWGKGLAAWDCLMRSDSARQGDLDLVERCNKYLNDVLGLGYTVRRDNRIQLPEDSAILSELRLFAAQYDERDGADLIRRVMEPLERLPRLAALQLHDEKRDIDINPMDIGVGVSQTLPVVVGAVEPNCTIFAVEQPELHIHPAVQSRMGDLFLRECLGTPGRIFLLETHSEHLMLRMLRRIRETADGELPPGYPRVTPEDVQVLYVESEGGITSIVPLPITEDGDFAQKWPHGFFTEREEDLF